MVEPSDVISNRCLECGATYAFADDSCTARFNALLALDHSRREPWGSRHGQAFAAFALQHPTTFATSLDRAWMSLYRIYVHGDRASYVHSALVGKRGATPTDWNTPARPPERAFLPAITIRDLGEFAAESYASQLDAWCRASLVAWGLPADALTH